MGEVPTQQTALLEQEAAVMVQEEQPPVNKASSVMEQSPPALLQSKNPSTATRKASGGLSELARQLRVLQAENKSQGAHIDRLERQLRILADLHGVSVSDLRAALTKSCQAEAFGEWQNRVTSLQAELEAALLRLNKQNQSSFENQADEQKVANLQLRVGELEELEEKQRAEIDKLYKDLAEESAKSTRLEAKCDLHQAAIDSYKKKLKAAKKKQKTENKKAEVLAVAAKTELATADPSESSRASEVEEKLDAILPIPPPVQQPSEQELIYEKQIKLLESQLENRDKDGKLRREQFDARFKQQDERIDDLEQQLSSLYVAFNLLQQEHQQEKETHDKVAEQLFSADSLIARQVERMERQKPSYAVNNNTTPPASPNPHQTPKQVSPVHQIPMSPASSTPQQISPMNSPSSNHSELAAMPAQDRENIMAGYLWKRGNFNRYRKRFAALCTGFADFKLYLSDTPGGRAKAYTITPFQSTIELTRESRPFTFRLSIDQYEAHSMVLAVDTKIELDRWFGALGNAIQGKGRETAGSKGESVSQVPVDDREALELDAALQASLGETGGTTTPTLSGTSQHEDQEASDLEAALQASLREVS